MHTYRHHIFTYLVQLSNNPLKKLLRKCGDYTNELFDICATRTNCNRRLTQQTEFNTATLLAVFILVILSYLKKLEISYQNDSQFTNCMKLIFD